MKVKTKLKFLAVLMLVLCSSPLSAQQLVGTTGLLHAPTADMQPYKTFIMGANQIRNSTTSRHFWAPDKHHTYNYYVNITPFPWLELGYTCTLVWAYHGSSYFPEKVWGTYANQDRSFYGRIRLWKEGWYNEWFPQVVLGLDDPATHSGYGGGDIVSTGEGGNNYLTRYYLAVTKHFYYVGYGILGVHASAIAGRSKSDSYYKRPALGVNFRVQTLEGGEGLFCGEPFCWQQILNGVNLMAEVCPTPEYRPVREVVNVGMDYQLYNDHVHVVAELNNGKHFNWGVQYRVHFK